MMVVRFSVVILTLLMVIPAYAQGLVGNVYGNGAKKHNVIVVEKAAKKLHVVSVDNNSQELVKSFSVLTGKNDGDKLVEGDERTPEGIYYIQKYMSSEELLNKYGEYAKIYGIGAYPTNYPNIVDKILRKTGHGIWVHGLDPVKHKPATQGCVALENWDLEEVQKYIGVGTPVVITENAIFTDTDSYEVERAKLLSMLYSYLNSWGENDFETFASFIHNEFRAKNGMRAEAYVEQKKRLMQAYPYKKIDIKDIKIYKENSSELLFDFEQFYCAENVVSFGDKQVYFWKHEDDFRVIAEEFSQRDATPFIQNSAEKFLEQWKAEWEGGNIDEYMASYSPRFRSSGRNYDAWKEYKEGLFEKNPAIVVGISDVKVNMLAPTEYEISFTQDYTAGDYSDRGVKTLTVSGCPGDFKILSEVWKSL